jgi:hypothetical protein
MNEELLKYKISFYAMLEGAMRFYESFKREQREDYKQYVESIQETKKVNRRERKKADKISQQLIKDYERKEKTFENFMVNKLERFQQTLNEKGEEAFDLKSTFYSEVCLDLMKVKNFKEIHALIKMYNDGMFDQIFEDLRKQREKEEKENDNVLQENGD